MHDRNGLFGHVAAYDGLEGLLFHQIDLDPQEIAEIVFQGYEPQQPHFGIVDLDQQIKVAALPGLAPDIGAEDAQGLDLPLFGELRLVLLQGPLDIIQRAGCSPPFIGASDLAIT